MYSCKILKLRIESTLLNVIIFFNLIESPCLVLSQVEYGDTEWCQTKGIIMQPGQEYSSIESTKLCNGKESSCLQIQPDGNLVVYGGFSNGYPDGESVLFASQTSCQPGVNCYPYYYLRMELNCQLMLYNSDNNAIWATPSYEKDYSEIAFVFSSTQFQARMQIFAGYADKHCDLIWAWVSSNTQNLNYEGFQYCTTDNTQTNIQGVLWLGNSQWTWNILSYDYNWGSPVYMYPFDDGPCFNLMNTIFKLSYVQSTGYWNLISQMALDYCVEFVDNNIGTTMTTYICQENRADKQSFALYCTECGSSPQSCYIQHIQSGFCAIQGDSVSPIVLSSCNSPNLINWGTDLGVCANGPNGNPPSASWDIFSDVLSVLGFLLQIGGLFAG